MNAVYFKYKASSTPNNSQIKEIQRVVKKETGQDLKVESNLNDVIFGRADNVEIEHIVLDVAESITKKVVGENIYGKKSDLILDGDNTHSVQPCFTLTKILSQAQINEIERLYEFVAGIKAKGYFNENRFYLDTKQDKINHIAMDVAEILVRRTIDGSGISVKKQSFKALARQLNEAVDYPNRAEQGVDPEGQEKLEPRAPAEKAWADRHRIQVFDPAPETKDGTEKAMSVDDAEEPETQTAPKPEVNVSFDRIRKMMS